MHCFQVQCFKKTAAFDKFAVRLLYVKKETFTPGSHRCHAGCSGLYYCRCALLAVLVSYLIVSIDQLMISIDIS